jgi:hypothetical protein
MSNYPICVLRLLIITTCDKEGGILLIEVFSKLFSTHNYGHQGSDLGGHFLDRFAVRIF